jgi:hypothetical protein
MPSTRAALAALIVLPIGLAGCVERGHEMETPAVNGSVQHLNPDGLHENPAYSQAVVVTGNVKTVYVGGQNAVDTAGTVVGKGEHQDADRTGAAERRDGVGGRGSAARPCHQVERPHRARPVVGAGLRGVPARVGQSAEPARRDDELRCGVGPPGLSRGDRGDRRRPSGIDGGALRIRAARPGARASVSLGVRSATLLD